MCRPQRLRYARAGFCPCHFVHPAILWMPGSERAPMTSVTAPATDHATADADWIRRTKQQLRHQLPELETVWADLLAAIERRRDDIHRQEQAGGSTLPPLAFAH